MQRAVVYALASAALFGASTPIAKALVGEMAPLLLAGLLYAGSGVGLLVVLAARQLIEPDRRVALPAGAEWLWLAAAILFGGIAAPIALMYGLVSTPASSASLLLNLEAVFTAILAWFVFRENFDRRIALGMAAIIFGGVTLAWTPGGDGKISTGSLFIAAACLCWAFDNNLTRRVSTAEPLVVAGTKGLVAAIVNIGVALALGQRVPGSVTLLSAASLGLLGYGVSLVLFVLALRNLGTARTGAYFSVAPFFGAALGVALLGDAVTWQLLVAGALMALGVWLHITEHHAHEHAHELLEHAHSHIHDEHHLHAHEGWDGREPHTHVHVHLPMVHSHPHYPDVHHRHPH